MPKLDKTRISSLPSRAYHQMIQAARERSLKYGLSTQDSYNLENQFDVKQLLVEHQLLVNAATPVLERLVSQLQMFDSDALLILANENATILSVAGNPDYQTHPALKDVVPGVCWSEHSRGTNALGTAIVESHPMLINMGEHFLDRLNEISCSSVLLSDPKGKVCGAISLARKGPLPESKDSLLLLSMTASYVDTRLFTSSHPQDITLAFHHNQHYLDSPWQGLLSVDLAGKIVAANTAACELLGFARPELLGQPCETFLGGRTPILSRLTKGLAGRLKTPKGAFNYKILHVPDSLTRTQTVVSKPDIKVKTSIALHQLAGKNPVFLDSLKKAEKGFNRDLPILLFGETGTGKEQVARAIHNSSERAAKPFIAVNCAAIPEGLIESELFGYSEGAFTGAKRGGSQGKLMQANGGTLFLDEVGDMPLALQARLLRVLQERKVTPLGSIEEQPLEIGLICATHRNLKTLIKNGEFREDLYYRINGLSIYLPALRDRKDFNDLAVKLLKSNGMTNPEFSAELMGMLKNYDWPGNIRQLEMVMRTLAALRDEDSDYLDIEHLPDSLLNDLQAQPRVVDTLANHSIRENESELIRQALAAQQGNVSAAARDLGISRATLYRKLKQMEDD